MSLRLIIALLATIVLTVGTADAASKKRDKGLMRQSGRTVVTRPADSCAIYWAGAYVGRDCDPNIRAQLLREFQMPGGNW